MIDYRAATDVEQETTSRFCKQYGDAGAMAARVGSEHLAEPEAGLPDPLASEPDTVGYNYVKIFDTPGDRNTSRDYSRQYEIRQFEVDPVSEVEL